MEIGWSCGGDRNRRRIDRSSGAGARWLARRQRWMARRTQCGLAWCGLERCGLAWCSVAWPLLSTSPLCVFPPSTVRTVLRDLCRRLLDVLVLGSDTAWLAQCLGLWPVRLRLLLRSPTVESVAAHSRVSGNPVAASGNAGSPHTRGQAAAVNPSALSFFRRPPEKSTSR